MRPTDIARYQKKPGLQIVRPWRLLPLQTEFTFSAMVIVVPFFSELHVKPASGDEWELVESLEYRTTAGDLIVVPVGFACDLASIPAPFRVLIPVNGEWTEAAVIHDWLYHSRIGSRANADLIFLQAMKELGVGWITRRAMYAAVRAFGWRAWSD